MDYARNVNDWQGVALTDDERARWVRGRPDLRDEYAASGHNMPGYLDANRERVDAVIVGDVAPWGERGELQRNETGLPVVIMGTCGTCGAAWNDTLLTAISPVPSARCPFEYDHDEAEEDEDGDGDGYSWSDASALWELQHGEPGAERTGSARAYLESRLGQ